MSRNRNIGEEILAGLRELNRGKAGRVVNIPPVVEIRRKVGLSQSRFATLLGVLKGRILQSRSRALEFDRVSLRVVEVHGRPHSGGTVSRCKIARTDAVLFKVALNRVCIPWLNLKTNMIHIRCSMVRPIATFLTQWPVGVDQID